MLTLERKQKFNDFIECIVEKVGKIISGSERGRLTSAEVFRIELAEDDLKILLKSVVNYVTLKKGNKRVRL